MTRRRLTLALIALLLVPVFALAQPPDTGPKLYLFYAYEWSEHQGAKQTRSPTDWFRLIRHDLPLVTRIAERQRLDLGVVTVQPLADVVTRVTFPSTATVVKHPTSTWQPGPTPGSWQYALGALGSDQGRLADGPLLVTLPLGTTVVVPYEIASSTLKARRGTFMLVREK